MDVQAASSLSSAARPPETGGPKRKPKPREGAPRPEASVDQPAKSPPPDTGRAQLERMAKMLEQQMRTKSNRRVGISLDEKTGEPVIRVTERSTGKLLRQIPPEEMRKLATSLARLRGIIVDQDA
jgi:flagellar protein FlaG